MSKHENRYSYIHKSQDYINVSELCKDFEADVDYIIDHYEQVIGPDVGRDAIWDIITDSNTDMSNANKAVRNDILTYLEKIHALKAGGKKRSHHKPALNITGKLIEAANSIGADADNLIDIYERNWSQGATLEAMRGHLAGVESHMRYAEQGKQDKIVSLLGQIFKAKQGREWKENLYENRGEKIEVVDLWFTDDNGREKINWYTLREFVQESFFFKTLKDTDELMVYKNGIYVDARKTIRDFVHTIKGIDDTASIRIIRELTEHIKARTGVEREIFNVDKNYLPLKNGLYNFETKKLEDFDPKKCYTFRLPVEYDPDAKHKALDKFLLEVVDKGDLDLMQEVFGYCLYQGFPSHHFFWLYGGGRNGKGVYTALLRRMLGEENIVDVPLSELDGHHRFAVARLRGKLANIVSEANTKNGIATEILKAMTGQDMMSGEEKQIQKPFNFINIAKFVLHSNEFPAIDDTSTAFWDRAVPVPFPNEFKGKNANKELVEDIIAEDTLSGIFNYALEGFYALVDNEWEFTPSETQKELKANMRRMAQPVKTFQEQWTELHNRAAVTADKLYNAMLGYCDEYGIIPLEKRDFVRDIKGVYGVKYKTFQNDAGYREYVFMGIRLTGKIEAKIAADAIGEQNKTVKEATEEDMGLLKDNRGLNRN